MYGQAKELTFIESSIDQFIDPVLDPFLAPFIEPITDPFIDSLSLSQALSLFSPRIYKSQTVADIVHRVTDAKLASQQGNDHRCS